MRFARQPINSLLCGPFAVLNAMKWAGASCSVKKMIPLFKTLCDSDEGTRYSDFDFLLRTMGRNLFYVKRTQSCSLSRLLNHLDSSDCAAIIAYKNKGASATGHYVLVFQEAPGLFMFINDHSYITVFPRQQDSFVQIFNRRNQNYPRVWFLKKCEL